MTLAVERMGSGGSREPRNETPVRIQRGAAGSLDLAGVDRGGDMGSDLKSKGAAEKVC